MSGDLLEYFNKQPRLGTLSTTDKSGNVNVAYFGSPRMIDERTVFMGLGKNRTFANLQENPHAVFMIMEPGKLTTLQDIDEITRANVKSPRFFIFCLYEIVQQWNLV